MINVQTIIDLFLSNELITNMGECAYQRTIYTLSVILPIMYLGFSMALCLLLLYGVFKVVTTR